jgi:hypothetical protein
MIFRFADPWLLCGLILPLLVLWWSVIRAPLLNIWEMDF